MKRYALLMFTAGCVSLLTSAAPAGARVAGTDTARVRARSLAIPRRAFSPAAVTKSFVDPNSNNTDPSVWPRLEHSTGYAAFGRVNGYYQEARWVLHSRRVITFNYDASFYRTANGAYRAWRDGSSYDLKFPGVRALACPPGIRLSCTRLYIPYSNRYDAFYDLIQHGRCLAELRALARPKPFNKRKSRMASTLATMDRAASARLEGVCR